MGIYTLKLTKARMDSNKQLTYHPIPHTIDIWKHKSRPITFCLYVDDFGVTYFHKYDVDHLLNALQQRY